MLSKFGGQQAGGREMYPAGYPVARLRYERPKFVAISDE